MNISNFKTMLDAHDRLGLYRCIHPAETTSISGWEKIADEEDFPSIRHALPNPDSNLDTTRIK